MQKCCYVNDFAFNDCNAVNCFDLNTVTKLIQLFTVCVAVCTAMKWTYDN